MIKKRQKFSNLSTTPEVLLPSLLAAVLTLLDMTFVVTLNDIRGHYKWRHLAVVRGGGGGGAKVRVPPLAQAAGGLVAPGHVVTIVTRAPDT